MFLGIKFVCNAVLCLCSLCSFLVIGRSGIDMENFFTNIQKGREDTSGDFLQFCVLCVPAVFGIARMKASMDAGQEFSVIITDLLEAFCLTAAANLKQETMFMLDKFDGRSIMKRGEKKENGCPGRRWTSGLQGRGAIRNGGYGEGNVFYHERVAAVERDREENDGGFNVKFRDAYYGKDTEKSKGPIVDKTPWEIKLLGKLEKRFGKKKG